MSKIIDPKGLAKPAQVGVDLTVNKIYFLAGQAVMKPNGKVDLPDYIDVLPTEQGDFYLPPGAYAVEFDQGIAVLEPNENAYIVQRSSLNRAGVVVRGSIYDPGFGTGTLGATIYVSNSITIAQHARIAQITIDENEPTDNMYDGQWQGKANK